MTQSLYSIAKALYQHKVSLSDICTACDVAEEPLISVLRIRGPTHWEADEISFLSENYQRYTDAQLAKILGKKRANVQRMRTKLGLPKAESQRPGTPDITLPGYGRIKVNGAIQRDVLDAYLKDHPDLSTEALANTLDIWPTTVNQWRIRLGHYSIRRVPPRISGNPCQGPEEQVAALAHELNHWIHTDEVFNTESAKRITGFAKAKLWGGSTPPLFEGPFHHQVALHNYVRSQIADLESARTTRTLTVLETHRLNRLHEFDLRRISTWGKDDGYKTQVLELHEYYRQRAAQKDSYGETQALARQHRQQFDAITREVNHWVHTGERATAINCQGFTGFSKKELFGKSGASIFKGHFHHQVALHAYVQHEIRELESIRSNRELTVFEAHRLERLNQFDLRNYLVRGTDDGYKARVLELYEIYREAAMAAALDVAIPFFSETGQIPDKGTLSDLMGIDKRKLFGGDEYGPNGNTPHLRVFDPGNGYLIRFAKEIQKRRKLLGETPDELKLRDKYESFSPFNYPFLDNKGDPEALEAFLSLYRRARQTHFARRELELFVSKGIQLKNSRAPFKKWIDIDYKSLVGKSVSPTWVFPNANARLIALAEEAKSQIEALDALPERTQEENRRRARLDRFSLLDYPVPSYTDANFPRLASLYDEHRLKRESRVLSVVVSRLTRDETIRLDEKVIAKLIDIPFERFWGKRANKRKDGRPSFSRFTDPGDAFFIKTFKIAKRKKAHTEEQRARLGRLQMRLLGKLEETDHWRAAQPVAGQLAVENLIDWVKRHGTYPEAPFLQAIGLDSKRVFGTGAFAPGKAKADFRLFPNDNDFKRLWGQARSELIHALAPKVTDLTPEQQQWLTNLKNTPPNDRFFSGKKP